MPGKFVVEAFKDGSMKKRRSFRTAEEAVTHANDFLDSHYDESGWDVQVITPTTGIHQMGINGNNTAKGMA